MKRRQHSSVTITGTLAQINALLNTDGTSAVSYIDNTDNPSASTTLTLQIDDGGATGTGGAHTGTDTSTINITAVNDAPVAAITPTEYDGPPNVAINLKSNGLSVSDVDGNAGSETVTLSVTSGTLTVTTGGSGAGVAGSGTSSVTITGTTAQIDALLNTDGTSTVSFLDSLGGTKTLTLHIDDNGNTGGGNLSGQDTASMTLNRPPTGALKISGDVIETGHVLTADTSAIQDADGLGPFHYQWMTSTDFGQTFTNVGTDSSTYTVTAASAGDVFDLKITYTDGGGTLEQINSTFTPADFDAQGRIPTQTLSGPGASHTLYQWDVDDTLARESLAIHFDQTNAFDFSLIRNDDGSRVLIDPDQANTFPFANAVSSYDAQNRLDFVTLKLDNGTTFHTDYDQAGTSPWPRRSRAMMHRTGSIRCRSSWMMGTHSSPTMIRPTRSRGPGDLGL